MGKVYRRTRVMLRRKSTNLWALKLKSFMRFEISCVGWILKTMLWIIDEIFTRNSLIIMKFKIWLLLTSKNFGFVRKQHQRAAFIHLQMNIWWCKWSHYVSFTWQLIQMKWWEGWRLKNFAHFNLDELNERIYLPFLNPSLTNERIHENYFLILETKLGDLLLRFFCYKRKAVNKFKEQIQW